MQILVRLPNWLGDLVMSAGFVDQLHRMYPTAAIDVIVKKGIDELCQYFHGIRQVHVFDKASYPGLRGAARFGRQLAFQQYDLAYCLPDSFSSAWMLKATGSRVRVGFRKELRSFLLSHAYNKPSGLHRVDQYVHLLEKHSGQPLKGTRVHLRQEGGRLANTAVVNVNSEADSRRLPVEKAISVLNALRAATDARLLLVGSPKEVPHVSTVYDGLANKTGVENLAGTTNLHGLIGLFSQTPVMLTTDSGPMHLANALGVHTVALEGASDERNTAPYNKDRSTLIRYGQLPCEPCVKNSCRYGTPKCLLSMDNTSIVAAVLAALHATKQTT